MTKYVYPALSGRDFSFFRLGGPGLANCMYVAARAYVRSKELNCELFRPTWERLGIGQWIRREKDKRFYVGLFKGESLWATIRRFWLSRFSSKVEKIEGLGDYFDSLIDHRGEIRSYFENCIEPEAIKNVPDSLSQVIGLHARMGDYPTEFRVPVSWYVDMVQRIRAVLGREVEVKIFSDGTDDELKELLSLPNVHRMFCGNALADIVALSRCGLILGSDSTFSGWAAFLGEVSTIFYRVHYMSPPYGKGIPFTQMMICEDVKENDRLKDLLSILKSSNV